MSGGHDTSRRRLLAAGGALAGGWGFGGGPTPLVPAAAGAVVAWRLLEPGAEAALAGLPLQDGPRAARTLVLGQQDVYAWWRREWRQARADGRALTVHGVTRWGACSLMAWCAEEAGLRLVQQASVDLRPAAALWLSWQIG